MLRALFTTLRNLFRPAVTVPFPLQIRPRPARYRTSFALLKDEHDEELCIGCLACERICPSSIITIKQAPKRESKVTGKKRGFVEDLRIDTAACVGCELCVQVCPTDALVMTQEPDAPVYAREDLVLGMARLYEHGQLRPHAWASGTRLMGMQEPPKGGK
jgi:NADH-quinone oxidoreductase subunit I